MLTGMRSSLLKRTLRSEPHVYSALCRARLAYSRSVRGAAQRKLYREHRELVAMTALEVQHCAALARDGYTVIPDVVPLTVVDTIAAEADRRLRAGQIGRTPIYSGDPPLAGMSYEQIAASQKLVTLSDPFLAIPAYVPIAFHESLLRITAHFLGYIPPTYQALIVRDFPHARPKYSSHFHKDNDEADSLQIFLYLEDIDETRGAQVYVPGSHRHDARSCRPRLSRDLGVDGYDGRLSDEEVARIYPREMWVTLRPTRGSIGFISGNGIHKGPVWGRYGDPQNQARTVCRIDVQGVKATHRDGPNPHRKLPQAYYERFSLLQRLFTGVYSVVTP
jgi:Phytanoyl-CoA dioxygenase (PhyH)